VFSSGRSGSEIQAVLEIVQAFHPPGVAARDLRESLMLQLERAERADSLEYRIVRDCMDELGRRRIREISKKVGDTVDAVQDALERIGNLEPRPGREYMHETEQFVVPEIFISRGDDGECCQISYEETAAEQERVGAIGTDESDVHVNRFLTIRVTLEEVAIGDSMARTNAIRPVWQNRPAW